jgi:hypothetical protein
VPLYFLTGGKSELERGKIMMHFRATIDGNLGISGYILHQGFCPWKEASSLLSGCGCDDSMISYLILSSLLTQIYFLFENKAGFLETFTLSQYSTFHPQQ